MTTKSSQGQKMSEEAEEKQLQKTEQRINKGKQKNSKINILFNNHFLLGNLGRFVLLIIDVVSLTNQHRYWWHSAPIVAVVKFSTGLTDFEGK